MSKGASSPFVSTSLEQRAWYALHSRSRNGVRDERRAALLRQNPSLRLLLATAPLRAIIDYAAFKCHPHASIAAGQAIHGSIIYGGLVVCKEEPTLDQQQRFVEALRCQGFAAQDCLGALMVEAAVRAAQENPGINPRVLDSVRHLQVLTQDSRVHFTTERAMECSLANIGLQTMTPQQIIYLAGCSIPDRP